MIWPFKRSRQPFIWERVGLTYAEWKLAEMNVRRSELGLPPLDRLPDDEMTNEVQRAAAERDLP